jgi:hypothetical protein
VVRGWWARRGRTARWVACAVSAEDHRDPGPVRALRAAVALGHFSSAETVSAAIRGVRLAISPAPPDRPLGVALYVDFTATAQDWAQYQAGWNRPSAR